MQRAILFRIRCSNMSPLIKKNRHGISFDINRQEWIVRVNGIVRDRVPDKFTAQSRFDELNKMNDAPVVQWIEQLSSKQ